MTEFIQSAVVVGATGLVGKALVACLHAEPSIKAIRVIVRSEAAEFLAYDKLEQVVVPDFMHINAEHMQGFSHLFSCLGSTLKKAGSKTNFYHIDYEMNAHIVDILKMQKMHYVVVSAEGANVHSAFFYNRVKGQLESYIQHADLYRVSILRPSLLLGERADSRLLEDVSKRCIQKLLPFLPKQFSFKPVTAEQVAHTMVSVAQFQNNQFEIYDNLKIQQSK